MRAISGKPRAGLVFCVNAALVALCLYSAWAASWIHAKAELAQWLVERAWERRLSDPDATVKPWSWADTQPVARLTLPNGERLIVLQGAQGNSLAFGPGLVEGSAPPGAGYAVIGGHRDTHFAALANARAGQILAVQTLAGDNIAFRISAVEVVDIQAQALAPTQENILTLVTCYPFDTVRSDPDKRWVVTAKPLQL